MTNTTWVADAMHSEIGFKVKHLMISTITGKFGTFDVSVQTQDDDFSTANISFSADVASVSTHQTDRDNHLKSPDFFDVANFPKISFTSTGMTKKDDGEYDLTGNLTIRDVTKSVSLKVEFGGIAKDPYGNTKAGFTVEGKISRAEFGLKTSILTDTGGVVIGDEIKIHCELEMLKTVA
ncbi:MAG: YceI family protein [Chitinophagaceae bacterium]